MKKKVTLPIISKISVEGYELYPGPNGKGMGIEFIDGVTVLAGINGVGKTTFLNLMLRMLLGPSNPSKSTRDIGRVSRRSLKEVKNFDYFQRRVPLNLNASSYGEIDFYIADNKFTVTRFLRDMKVKAAKVNGKKIEVSSEIGFMENLAKMAGFSSGYDFHVAVRYLQFFTEERLPILWSAESQFEFFKILFFDEDISVNLNALFSDIQKLDTDYRNRFHQLSKKKDELARSETPTDVEIVSLDKAIRETEISFEHVKAKYSERRQDLIQHEKNISIVEAKIEELEVLLSGLEQEFSFSDALYIFQSLPSLDDKLQLLMQGIGVGAGCFVCGNRGKREAQQISRKLRHGHCFVCNATVTRKTSGNVVPISSDVVNDLEKTIGNLRLEMEGLQTMLNDLNLRYRNALDQIKEVSNERASCSRRLDALYAQRPSHAVAPVSEVRGEIDREEGALRLVDADRKRKNEDYRSGVSRAQSEMDSLKVDLTRRLTSYAEAFLHESVKVNFKRNSPFKVSTGTSSINIPSFSIAMTSSTHKVPEDRESVDSVSESQREFLDLAFRMTLIDMISGDGKAMLVIETPEASLDSWFMKRAADLMRSFAVGGAEKRKLIATSNLNGTLMIPGLLGILDEEGRVDTGKLSSEAKIIDLMELTAPSKIFSLEAAKSSLKEEIGRYKNG